jgi:hypothetical protein
MTLNQIEKHINNSDHFFGEFGTGVKLWLKNGFTRFYLNGSMGFISIINDVAVYEKFNRKGFYESQSQFEDRVDSDKKMITDNDVIARYINFLIKH